MRSSWFADRPAEAPRHFQKERRKSSARKDGVCGRRSRHQKGLISRSRFGREDKPPCTGVSHGITSSEQTRCRKVTCGVPPPASFCGVSAHQPDDFNGYGYFYLRVFCTCLGFQANVVEKYGLLTALQHIFAGFEEDSRSEVVFWIDEWSIELGYHWFDVACASCRRVETDDRLRKIKVIASLGPASWCLL